MRKENIVVENVTLYFIDDGTFYPCMSCKVCPSNGALRVNRLKYHRKSRFLDIWVRIFQPLLVFVSYNLTNLPYFIPFNQGVGSWLLHKFISLSGMSEAGGLQDFGRSVRGCSQTTLTIF